MKLTRASTTIWIAGLALLVACGDPTKPSPADTTSALPEIPVSGTVVSGMTWYDKIIPDLLRKHNIPGGALAVVRDGKLIYARGFGYADVENKTVVQPDALFRIASVSKPITGAAIMKLVEDGKLKLDDRVAPLIADLTPVPGATVDPRWEQITIRHLLNHTAGWDRAVSFDPMFLPSVIAAATGTTAPASAEAIIRYMKGKPLDFNPGERFAYSNFGYDILGRVIERLSGMPYETFVRTRVLQPAGATRTRLGKTRLSDALPDEVRYYWTGADLNWPMGASVFPGQGTVPHNYGAFYTEAMDSHGGWVSSTVDLLRFLTAVDGRVDRPDILSAGLVTEMTTKGAPACAGNGCYYAAGWFVGPAQGVEATWSHGGDLPGTTALLVRLSERYSWVALFNANPLFTAKPPAVDFKNELDAALWNALSHVTSYPTHDLFSTFK
jgi:N-acyl-D-amino-acid deacylase